MKLTVTFGKPQLNISAAGTALSTSTGTPVARSYVQVPQYEGAYTVTPTAETQTLQTNGLRMTDNITIEPIPSNYGLITWNGSTITVS